ncbi:hypothetical protein J0X19_16385 [Hymenobacter sp. BT186]|uniref:Uncharacterized protein n=1 Tax=Hymenobacter telluris TaxID=2816474 RepID=A0A939EYI2_9BACT|nr:hypothetical protein [Hymenobacter telluris]MBO0359539.1 hypothetical protein [Hymenobacter telluris]MBW3375565.1 hypothetical protein [Hymenobacter norwichensis]
MKHLAAFLLLAVFLYNLVGVYPVAMWQQHQLRREAERMRHAALPDEALVRIVVARQPEKAAPLIHWQEEHEFSYRGQLYDVVRQRATPDSVTYFCWHDHDEEKLLAGLTKHVREYAHPAAGARKSAKKAFSFLFKLTYLVPAGAALPAVADVKSQLAYPEYSAPLPVTDAPVHFPPPRCQAISRG